MSILLKLAKLDRTVLKKHYWPLKHATKTKMHEARTKIGSANACKGSRSHWMCESFKKVSAFSFCLFKLYKLRDMPLTRAYFIFLSPRVFLRFSNLNSASMWAHSVILLSRSLDSAAQRHPVMVLRIESTGAQYKKAMAIKLSSHDSSCILLMKGPFFEEPITLSKNLKALSPHQSNNLCKPHLFLTSMHQ